MSKVSIWRLEYSDGMSIYRVCRSPIYWQLTAEYCVDFKHPGPEEDPILKHYWNNLRKRQDYVFGFATIKQYHDWFTEPYFRELMGENGIVLKQFSIQKRHIKYGEKQVIFKKTNTKFIEDFRPDFFGRSDLCLI